MTGTHVPGAVPTKPILTGPVPDLGEGRVSPDRSPGTGRFARTEQRGRTVSFNPLEHRGIPLDRQIRNWRELDPRRIEGPIPVECRSASCGTYWVGILGGAEKLTDVAAREGKKIKEFGYIDTAEAKPLIRLACQAQALGAVSIVIPPWNGVFGKYLKALREDTGHEKAQTEKA